jgi:hypothetical protein
MRDRQFESFISIKLLDETEESKQQLSLEGKC